ncbi:MAG: cysteine--tRNA ligase [Methanobrevibacter sp.]|jgi:cysteinyl-tRNA synthetase|nr:cysteine--tRNA ligase [Candidatus Methanovirga australis]
MLEIYNTMNRKKEKFVSRNSRINLFVCGPTVYDDAHIGHGRTYISFDMIKRYLEFIGYSVFYLENITDIDDKIIIRAKERKTDFLTLARFYENRFKEDMKRLNVDSVNLYPRATNHLEEIHNQIDILIEKGFAYESEDGIYFEVEKFPGYGKLSHQKLDKLEAHREIAKTTKKSPNDFALWKKTDEKPYFPSKFGNGRPGWHIEDTAITEQYFGPQYDIHGGGLDLIFPHHEAEIAQMEAISSLEPMVKYWLHTGFLNVDGEKMSKSLGNFITIRELLQDWDPMAFRLFILSTHYKNPIDFSQKALNQAVKNLERLKNTLNNLLDFKDRIVNYSHKNNLTDFFSFEDDLDISIPFNSKNSNLNNSNHLNSNKKLLNSDILLKIDDLEKEFFKHMDDDFNTPRSLAAILNFTKNINSFINDNISLIDNNKINQEDLDISYNFTFRVLRFFVNFEKIFNLNLFEKEDKNLDSNKFLDILLETRDKLRKEKNYHLSDYIRDKINGLGVKIEDN